MSRILSLKEISLRSTVPRFLDCPSTEDGLPEESGNSRTWLPPGKIVPKKYRSPEITSQHSVRSLAVRLVSFKKSLSPRFSIGEGPAQNRSTLYPPEGYKGD